VGIDFDRGAPLDRVLAGAGIELFKTLENSVGSDLIIEKKVAAIMRKVVLGNQPFG
jgi:hypothetical protein